MERVKTKDTAPRNAVHKLIEHNIRKLTFSTKVLKTKKLLGYATSIPLARYSAQRTMKQYLSNKYNNQNSAYQMVTHHKSKLRSSMDFNKVIASKKNVEMAVVEWQIMAYASNGFIESLFDAHLAYQTLFELKKLYKFCLFTPYVKHRSLGKIYAGFVKAMAVIRNKYVHSSMRYLSEKSILNSSFDVYDLSKYKVREIIIESYKLRNVSEIIVSHLADGYSSNAHNTWNDKALGLIQGNGGINKSEVSILVYDEDRSYDDMEAANSLLQSTIGYKRQYRFTQNICSKKYWFKFFADELDVDSWNLHREFNRLEIEETRKNERVDANANQVVPYTNRLKYRRVTRGYTKILNGVEGRSTKKSTSDNLCHEVRPIIKPTYRKENVASLRTDQLPIIPQKCDTEKMYKNYNNRDQRENDRRKLACTGYETSSALMRNSIDPSNYNFAFKAIIPNNNVRGNYNSTTHDFRIKRKAKS